jgi:AraC family transcriptional regulator
MTVASAPTVVRADYLSVIYLPPGNRTPRDVAEANMQLIVGTQATPMIKVVPPTRRVLPVAVEDRVVFALPPERISGENGSIEAQEALDPYLYGIGHTLRCGFRTGQVPPQAYLQSLAPQIAQHLRDHYPVRERQRQRDGLGPTRLWQALAMIETRFSEPLAVEDIAKEVKLSPFHFARMFRRSTGDSPHAYITRRRIDQAKVFLATTDEPIGKIARLVGYRTQAHFTHVFHDVEGMTPRQFRLTRQGKSKSVRPFLEQADAR